MKKIVGKIPLNVNNSAWRIGISSWTIISLLLVALYLIILQMVSPPVDSFIKTNLPYLDITGTDVPGSNILRYLASLLIVSALPVYFSKVLVRLMLKKELRKRVEKERKMWAQYLFMGIHIDPISEGRRLSERAILNAERFARKSGIPMKQARKRIDKAVSAGIEARDARRNKEIVFVGEAKVAMIKWFEYFARMKEEKRARVPAGRKELLGIKPVFRIIFSREDSKFCIDPDAEIKKTDRVFTYGRKPKEFKIVVNALLLKRAGKFYMFKHCFSGTILPVSENPVQ